MYIPRWRESRGFSAGAAFLFAVILAGTGIAIQATLPATATPKSLTAASVLAVDVEDPGAVQDASCRGTRCGTAVAPSVTSGQRLPKKAGYDAVAFLSGQNARERRYPVCPVSPVMTSASLARFKQNADQIKSKAINGPASKFGDPANRCKTSGANLIPNDPNANTWQQWTIQCSEKSTVTPGTGAPVNGQLLIQANTPMTAAAADATGGDGATVVEASITDAEVNELLQEASLGDKYTCTVYAPNERVPGTVASLSPQELQRLANQSSYAATPAERELIRQDIPPQDQAAFDQALRDQRTQITTANEALATERAEVQARLSALSAQPCQNAAVASVDSCDPTALRARLTQIDAQTAANQARLNNLAAAAVPLDPDANRPVNRDQPGPGVYNRDLGTGYNGAYPSGFNGSNVPSPLGGACTNGYVCMGNTLYYQSVGGGMYGGYGGGTGQCQTIPMQQCPYGCQQPFGAGQTGTQNTMGGLMAGLQLGSAIANLFGGGNNNSAMMMNANQSRSCAMSPQQQSPYGTGTNGQPCTQQQTPQPDPSQCTSGAWQPLSQNGCQSGWQCVPNGSSGGNQPTAQLSCQPQIADVGTPISFSFSCGNASGSAGTGFDTAGALSGNATSTAPAPPAGQNTATYALTCIKLGVTTSAQCQVQLGRPGIVLVTNPKTVTGGDTSLIGWITSGMDSCVISSPDQQDFTARNAANTSTNGAATTSPIVKTSRFQLDCLTLGGGSKQATTTVTMN